MRQYWPALEPDLPLVVYFHGGRFFSGDLESHDTLCRQLALSGGCRVVAVDYRLGPEHRFPAAVEDACLAVDWALAQGVPTGVAGDSAGANLAAVAAIAHKGSALRCQLLVYPMIDATCSLPSYSEFADGLRARSRGHAARLARVPAGREPTRETLGPRRCLPRT